MPRQETDEYSLSALTYAGSLPQFSCPDHPGHLIFSPGCPLAAFFGAWSLQCVAVGAVGEDDPRVSPLAHGRFDSFLPNPRPAFRLQGPPQSSITSGEPSTARTLCLRPLEARGPRPRCRQGRFLVRAVRGNVSCLFSFSGLLAIFGLCGSAEASPGARPSSSPCGPPVGASVSRFPPFKKIHSSPV